jgi:hypothetical protein
MLSVVQVYSTVLPHQVRVEVIVFRREVAAGAGVDVEAGEVLDCLLPGSESIPSNNELYRNMLIQHSRQRSTLDHFVSQSVYYSRF